MKKAIAILLATVMSTAMLTGCGSDSTTKESTQATESSVAETAAATTEAAATEAADKTEGGVLVFGTNAEFPPFEYVGDDGEPDQGSRREAGHGSPGREHGVRFSGKLYWQQN